MAKQLPHGLKRITETDSYRGIELPSSKPEDFVGVEMVLVNMIEQEGQMRNERTGKYDPYYEMYCIRLADYDPSNDESETILVKSGAQFFRNFYQSLDPKELPIVFKFAMKGRSPFME